MKKIIALALVLCLTTGLLSGCNTKVIWENTYGFSTIKLNLIGDAGGGGHILIVDDGKVEIKHVEINYGEVMDFTISSDDINDLFNYIINENDFFKLEVKRFYGGNSLNPDISEEIIVTYKTDQHRIYLFGSRMEEIYGNIKTKIIKVLNEYTDVTIFKEIMSFP